MSSTSAFAATRGPSASAASIASSQSASSQSAWHSGQLRVSAEIANMNLAFAASPPSTSEASSITSLASGSNASRSWKWS